MNIVVFEDDRVSQLTPVSLGRPAWAISCASYRLIDWLQQLQLPASSVVRPHLQTLHQQDFPGLIQNLDEKSPLTLAVNARLVPSRANFEQLQQLVRKISRRALAPGSANFVSGANSKAVAAAVIPTSQIKSAESISFQDDLQSVVAGLDAKPIQNDDSLDLLDYPHDIVRFHLQCFHDNMQHRIGTGSYREIADGVFSSDGASLPNNVAVDASHGPIVIESGVSIGPFASLRGPVYLGPNVKISEHASIKDEVSIGHTCKIGGEVEASVIEPYSNKQHYGFLGHAYVGSWVNLGAGTCNSDLKNTYGLVNMRYGESKVATGMQFMGCVIGDYAKTAINTSIFTGKQIGVGSMVYGWVAENVPSFVNYAKSFGSISLMPADVIIKMQQRMFGRRKVPQRACDIQLIRDMFDLTAADRPDNLPDCPPEL